uniref:Uncharacterized protein n=1 Tax=Tetranychus urticae TaxID=32264 RepID=T1L2Y1_TETUR
MVNLKSGFCCYIDFSFAFGQVNDFHIMEMTNR